MNCVIFLQARMGSRRLPGKALREVAGKPLLSLLLERLKRSREKEAIVLLTTSKDEDRPLVELAERTGVLHFRGSEENVLDRFYQAAKHFVPEVIIRITGDCPLIDPDLVDEVTRFFKKGEWDYVSNTLTPTFPDGLDTEVFHFEGLKQCWRESIQKYQKEHVTPYFYENPDRFRLANYGSPVNHSGLRWVVDEEADLRFIRAVYERLYPRNPNFGYPEVLALLEREPELKKINSHIPRSESFFKGGKIYEYEGRCT